LVYIIRLYYNARCKKYNSAQSLWYGYWRL